tara:strand:- start:715 stop:912 length:198 start_codon:yes stop_codon:yes gene_type:complete
MKLKEYIKSNGFTLESFSDLCGISYTTFIKWAYAKRIPSRSYMRIIYRKTNGKVSPNDFYDLEDK